MSDTFLSAAAARVDEQQPSEIEGPRAIVLVGQTGEGKSTTGNTLCGRAAFPVDGGLSSVTSEVAHADYLHISEEGLNEMRVIDTIGLHDTRLPAIEVMRRFRVFAHLAPCGIDCFLFIVRWGRFRPDHEAAVDAFVANCGDAALAHTVVVFTCCSLNPAELSAQLETAAPPSLRRLLSQLPTAPIGVDNVGRSAEARRAIHAAIEEVCQSRRRYSNTALAEARERHNLEKEEERAAFAAAVADWRKGSGPVVVEREMPSS